jgi:ABC-type glycerol-3-phosphate transport system substrate-binding protein
VAVVNEPELAEAIGRLRGEWAERSGGELSVAAMTWKELSAAKVPEADVIVFPSRYLGELCIRGWLRPVRSSVLESEDFDAADIFPLVRDRLMTFDGQIMAVPLGVDLPVMCYRADLFGKSQPPKVIMDMRQPPTTWTAYLKWARDSNPNLNLPEPTYAWVPPSWEPIDSWGAILLLARAASYISGSDHVLFNPDTMRPLINGPAFVRSLDELRVANELMYFHSQSPKSELERKLRDPRAASTAKDKGEPRLVAIGLPPAGHRAFSESLSAGSGNDYQIGWTQIPGSDETLDESTGVWERQAVAHRVPLLGVGDRLAAVTSSSRNAASAFQLLAWLAQRDTSSQLARAATGPMPVRRSLASSPVWYDSAMTPAERADLDKTLSAALGGQRALVIPRISAVDEYMTALDEAVKAAVVDKVPPQTALDAAVKRWEQITDAHGRDAQRRSYLKHLGISEP